MDPAVAAAVADAHRRDWGFVLAATARITRDLDAAEDCVQDAYAEALVAWANGVPARPGAWLTLVARRRAMNLIRRKDTLSRKLPLLAGDATMPGPGDGDDVAMDSIPDDRLRLIFTCCHPALPAEARVALTLRLLCGLTTAEVASAFLVSEPAMAARITRANRAIAIGESRGPRAGLAALDQLAADPQLAGYHYLPAARADFLRRLDRADDARLAYHEALVLAGNPVERDFLARRLAELDG